LVAAGKDGTVKVWDIRLEARTAAEISGLIRRRMPWRPDHGLLLPAQKASAASLRTSSSQESAPE
jgi:hypothetical protein